MGNRAAYEMAREAVAGLQAQIAEYDAQTVKLEQDTQRLEEQAGAAMIDGGDSAELEAQLGKLQARAAVMARARGILQQRLIDAQARQREAIAAELRRQADALQAEHERKAARVNQLFKELEGLGVKALASADCVFYATAEQIERLQRAADAVLARQHVSIDPSTGRRLDADLW